MKRWRILWAGWSSRQLCALRYEESRSTRSIRVRFKNVKDDKFLASRMQKSLESFRPNSGIESWYTVMKNCKTEVRKDWRRKVFECSRSFFKQFKVCKISRSPFFTLLEILSYQSQLGDSYLNSDSSKISLRDYNHSFSAILFLPWKSRQRISSKSTVHKGIVVVVSLHLYSRLLWPNHKSQISVNVAPLGRCHQAADWINQSRGHSLEPLPLNRFGLWL